jgi:hypothetical protein
MAAALNRDLARIGRLLVWWRAQFKLICSIATILGCLWFLSLIDVFVQYGRFGRITSWIILIGLVAAAARWIQKAMAHRFTPLGVAAELEISFPELDNHLINYLQFSNNPDKDPFKAAYVKKGAPKYSSLELKRMKNVTLFKRSLGALALSIVLLLLPGAFMGKAWATAVLRVVNPFSSVQPVCLTHILEVKPGNTTVLKGSSVVLTGVIQGKSGHEVRLDVDPDDGAKTTYALGSITSGEAKEFPHHITKIGTSLRYRFRAGDAPATDWYTVTARPPLAFTDLRLAVAPPGYTRRLAVQLDAVGDELLIPVGSEVTIYVSCNTPLKSVSLTDDAGKAVVMTKTGKATDWMGTVTLSNGGAIRLKATDTYDAELTQRIAYTPILDNPPSVEVVSPLGRTVLSPGEQPKIEFRVIDDYGLVDVTIEQVTGRDKKAPTAQAHRRWNDMQKDTFHQVWQGKKVASDGGALEFRIVARDTCPFATNVTTSASVYFNADSIEEASKKLDKLEKEAFVGLQQLLELQRRNIATTRKYVPIAADISAHQWNATAERQREIRTHMKALLENPINPLGKLTTPGKKLYLNEMAQVITELSGIPKAKEEARTTFAKKALNMEEMILRQLSFVESAAGDAAFERKLSALGAMLAGLIDGQKDVAERTVAIVKQSARFGDALIDRQDELASDLVEFSTACSEEASQVMANDPTFAQTIATIGKRCTQDKIRDDMLLSSDRLDQGKGKDALGYQVQAIKKLQALQAIMDGVLVAEEKEKRVEMLAAVEQAKEKISKVKDLHEKMLAAMEMVKEQEDLSEELVDMMEEDYEELVRNTKEAMLEVPNDLHIFTDLNAANDIVEDVFSIFEEAEFKGDEDGDGVSDDVDPASILDVAFAKEEAVLDAMDEAEDRMDDFEMWLGEKGDKLKVETEAFDKEEMPEEGMALGALPTEVEDLIGDLQEESEEVDEAADDAATNRGMTDTEAGGEVIEGDISTFSAKGKSGNDAPDHKEQDGRSNVGRQGMSVGETAAGSGTIGEGDKNIEERRTQDGTQSGQVDLDGEADTKATGGGKLATGKADDVGMGGGVKRMDSNEAGSWEGMAALMAKQADATYAKASMQNIRADSLKVAAHHLRQSGDAIAEGDITAMKEFKKLAMAALVKGKAELEAGPQSGFAIEGDSRILDDVVEGGPDYAPPKYRDLVADYYKRLNETL